MDRFAHPTREKPLSVSQMTRLIKGALEQTFPRVWLVGEISNFKRASSGHWYFSLKDAEAQIRCNMWRSYTHGVPFRPADGAEVLVGGNLNVYAPRGEYSLIVEQMEELGLGRLRAQFERLKARLAAEGLFHPDHKKPLPLLPRKIGIVTSPTGAALRDILRVLGARFAGLHVLIFPARVQGDGAAYEIAEGIRYLDQRGQCDVIIVGRGGGSEEDLWCFNEEVTARAIFEARTPIISAVGHEVDITIADYVADLRAATPSNAAELVVRSHTEYRQAVDLFQRSMERAMQRKLLILRNRINISESHPIFTAVRSRVHDAQRRLADLDYRMQRRVDELLQNRRLRLLRAVESLSIEQLAARAMLLATRLATADRELTQSAGGHLERNRQLLAGLAHRLQDLSPLKVLSRGYAAVYDSKDRVLRDPADVRIGELIRVRLDKGELNARVVDKPRDAVQQNLFDE
ncbi:MAG: exodeoxyribonuclease VII large subunit [Acidobacteriota bacterium]|nr:exodeoxyribonuclease VII large subunit [Acidobacteriota bacterium]